MAELQPESVNKLRQSSRLGQAAAAAASSGGCDFASDILKPIDPIRTLKSEAGTIDYFDEAEQQLLCVGAYLLRVVIDYRGLMLPRYSNGAILAFAVQGKVTLISLMLSICIVYLLQKYVRHAFTVSFL
jgi:hypothetical protein